MPAARMRRLSSAVNAPRSQNTSIQRLCGAQACSISPQTSSTYSSRRSAYSAGTTCAPRNVTSGVTSAASRASRASSSTVSPYPVLTSNVVVPWAAQLGDEAGEPAAQLVVARGPRRGDRATYAAGGIRRARHARLELVGAVAAEDEVGVAVDEPRDDGPAAGIHHLVSTRVPRSRLRSRVSTPGASREQRRVGGEPTHAMRPPSISTAASRSVPHGSPSRRDVGRQLADVRDQRGAHSILSCSASRRFRSAPEGRQATIVRDIAAATAGALTASAPSGRARARPPSRGRSRRRRGA